MLAYGVLLNLMLIVAIYGLKYFYTIEKINNVYSFIYGGIAIYNRYLMLSSVCLFIICLYFAIEQNVTLFKSLFFIALLFAFTHSIYLQNKYSLIRSENMSLFSLPEGSYQDNENIYKYLRTKKNILFVDCIKKKANVKKTTFHQNYLQ